MWSLVASTFPLMSASMKHLCLCVGPSVKEAGYDCVVCGVDLFVWFVVAALVQDR